MSAVSIFFYFRFVMAMYLREGKDGELVVGGSLRVVAFVCLVVTLALGIYPRYFIDEAGRSGRPVAKHIADAGR